MPDKKVGVRVGLTSDSFIPPAEGANFFHFTRVGHEIQLLVGSVNLFQLHEAQKQGESGVVVPQITHRFQLSPLGFATLKSQLEEIAKSVPPSDVAIAKVPDE